MCGIFSYLGDAECVKILVQGLQRLEYRGYDSAGLSTVGADGIKTFKKVGKVVNLDGISSENGHTNGISHTRWATHGKPNDVNSHPHSAPTPVDPQVSVVHNGIITNHAALRAELEGEGYKFNSETDSEVLAFLVLATRVRLGDNVPWTSVVAAALKFVQGTFGCIFLFKDSPNMQIAARRGSPLILGITDNNALILASDGSAIIEHTSSVVYIDENELVEMYAGGEFKIDSLENASAATRGKEALEKLELNLEQIEKGGYEHFMLKEIMDQPNSLRNCLRGRLVQDNAGKYSVVLGGLESLVMPAPPPRDNLPLVAEESSPTPNSVVKCASAAFAKTPNSPRISDTNVELSNDTAMSRLKKAKRILITACGTSWHAGLIGEYLFEKIARIPVEVEFASEFRYRSPILRKDDDIVIAISQSGETADTLEAIRLAKKHGVMTFGVVNVVGSTIARETDAGVYLHAGPEVGVASTKAFTGQCIVLTMIALRMGFERGTIDEKEYNDKCAELAKIPDVIERYLPSAQSVKDIAKYYRLAANFLFLGRGFNFPVALEGALKLKEISYIHAEGYPAAEMKHGPIALIDRFMPVVIIALRSDPVYSKVVANIEEVKARCGSLIVITDEGNHELDELAEYIIHVPCVDTVLQPLITVLPLQLLSYYIANMRGCNIDQPRNLAKSVTVE